VGSVKGDNGTSGIKPPTPGEAYGVWGDTDEGAGVIGTSRNLMGVWGASSNDDGIVGVSEASQTGSGVVGFTFDVGPGVWGDSEGTGIYGTTEHGVSGRFSNLNSQNDNAALWVDTAGTASAVYANALDGAGVYAFSVNGNAVYATSGHGNGTFGFSQSTGIGAVGYSVKGTGVYGRTDDTQAYAGYFDGTVFINGTLNKSATTFIIDHPLDPANKYLSHSGVESPDMKNLYDGIVVLDQNGEATVELAQWFEALNTNLRYQLTCIGEFAPVYVAQKVRANTFRIAGGKPGMEVCWQLTGVRQDPYARAHRVPVERQKNDEERGRYLHPGLYGRGESNHIDNAMHIGLKRQIEQAENWRIERHASQNEQMTTIRRAKIEALKRRVSNVKDK
jgi:hypothetical protein